MNKEAKKRMCVRWQKQNVTKEEYQYDYSYKIDNQYVDKGIINATLGTVNQSGVINVTDIDSGHTILYTLKLWNQTSKCFVLTREVSVGKSVEESVSVGESVEKRSTEMVECEVHAWLSKPGQYSSTLCEKEYNETCGNIKFETFSDHDCM
uniref:Lipocalin n=1 Tax=Rhipicephalus zambeziensis TaxID=60191 RepID=A0A224YIF7_9ACAR